MDCSEPPFDVIPSRTVSLIVGKRRAGKSTLIADHINRIISTRPIQQIYVVSMTDKMSFFYKRVIDPNRLRLYYDGTTEVMQEILDDNKSNHDACLESILILDNCFCYNMFEVLMLKLYTSHTTNLTTIVATDHLRQNSKFLLKSFDYIFLSKQCSMMNCDIYHSIFPFKQIPKKVVFINLVQKLKQYHFFVLDRKPGTYHIWKSRKINRWDDLFVSKTLTSYQCQTIPDSFRDLQTLMRNELDQVDFTNVSVGTIVLLNQQLSEEITDLSNEKYVVEI